MKALVDARSDRILGFAMIGSEAGEVMASVQTAMLAGMPYTGLRDAILAHPTMAEGLGALFSNVQPARARERPRPDRSSPDEVVTTRDSFPASELPSWIPMTGIGNGGLITEANADTPSSSGSGPRRCKQKGN